jgi:hypothetical protein
VQGIEYDYNEACSLGEGQLYMALVCRHSQKEEVLYNSLGTLSQCYSHRTQKWKVQIHLGGNVWYEWDESYYHTDHY